MARTHVRTAATYAACVLAAGAWGICQGAAIADVPGAYYNGKPTPPGEAGGRVLYMSVLHGFGEFGFPQYNEPGECMLYLVAGNLPGRRDARLTWGREYGAFMHGEGFASSVVDRCVYYLRGSGEKLLITTGVHVDDCTSGVRDLGAGARSCAGGARASAGDVRRGCSTRRARM